jgi:hypothetical protein
MKKEEVGGWREIDGLICQLCNGAVEWKLDDCSSRPCRENAEEVQE